MTCQQHKLQRCSNFEIYVFAIVQKFHGGSIDLSNVYLFLYQKASDNVGDGDEAHMGEILELDVLEELQKTSDRDSPEGVERPVANHVLPNTWKNQIQIFFINA